jgi:uncharacterized protein (UPF0335 family)
MKKPKLRIPVAKPGSRHKSKKDYDRKDEVKKLRKELKQAREIIERLYKEKKELEQKCADLSDELDSEQYCEICW